MRSKLFSFMTATFLLLNFGFSLVHADETLGMFGSDWFTGNNWTNGVPTWDGVSEVGVDAKLQFNSATIQGQLGSGQSLDRWTKFGW